MPWIKVIFADEAKGDLKDVYRRIEEQRGTPQGQSRIVAPPMLHSLNPRAMWYGAELMWEIMRGESRLTTAQREMIATVTSVTLSCRY